MTKKLLIALAATGLILPGVASAHTTRAELRHDHKVVHKEKRELASARKELREDRHDWNRTHRH